MPSHRSSASAPPALLRRLSAPASTLLAAALIVTSCSDTKSSPAPVSAAGAAQAAGNAGAPAGEAPASASSADAGAAAATANAAGSARPLSPLVTDSGAIRIMAIGDSVTRATCWRAALWDHLQQSFPDRFDLVGTLSSDNGCSPANYDRDNQGYSSSLVTEIVAGISNARSCDPSPCPTLSDLQQAFTAQTPDVALIHFGTNDVWNAKPTEDIVNAYSAVVDSLRAANPKVVIFVAQIIPLHVTDRTCSGCSCANCASDVPALDARIVSWAAEHDTPDSPIRVVDQYTGYDPVADNRDGVHPNDQGSKKMAERWFDALAPLFIDESP